MRDSSEINRSRSPRVLTNLGGLQKSPDGVQWVNWPPGDAGLLNRGRALLHSLSCDYIFMDGLNRDGLMFALLKRLVPFYPPRLVLMNLLMKAPEGGRSERVAFRLTAWLLGSAWRIIQYHRDTRALQAHLRLPAERFDYIPFKINQREMVEQTRLSDGGYIFCGGKTRRDFDTFIAAVAPLPYPVKIVTTSNDDIAQHGSFLADRPLPSHIEVVRLDGSAKPFIELIAGARLVALPIKPDICGVGIGVYILAMALRKCVVVTDGPATAFDLNDDLAVIVPPQDAGALREAIERVYNDHDHRERIAANAYQYATTLGGEERLLASIVSWLQHDWRKSKSPAAMPARS